MTLGVGGGSGTTTGLAFASSIDVHGSSGFAGGTVTFQAPVTANGAIVNFANVQPGQNVGLNMTLNGTVTGAASVVAEAVQSYVYDVSLLTITPGTNSSSSLAMSTIETNANNFMQTYGSSIVSGLGTVANLSAFNLQSGVLIENKGVPTGNTFTGGDVTVASLVDVNNTDWGNLSTWRPGGEPRYPHPSGRG